MHVQHTLVSRFLWRSGVAIILLCCSAVILPTRADERKPQVNPPGQEKSTQTGALELGAKILQTDDPVEAMDIYLVGFHPLKDDPTHQIEAHHFCRQVNEDFAQCVLFDGNTAEANLTGIEYIISENLFASLPEEEQQYWHPHNYEILSGQLVAPGIPAMAEEALIKGKINSYGKTWHVWNTGSMEHQAEKLPLGKPMLAWSFNRDGEANPGLVERRDKTLGINTSDLGQERQKFVPLAKPQAGVDVLNGQVPRPTQSIAGVTDANTDKATHRSPSAHHTRAQPSE
jgi:hypothetical protein